MITRNRPSVKLAKVDGDASSLSDDDDASYGSDEEDKRLRIVKAYSPSKNGQSIAVREKRLACSCTGREDNALVKKFVVMLEEDFDNSNYLVVGERFRELRFSFEVKEASYIMRAWTYSDSMYASLNNILSKMKK